MRISLITMALLMMGCAQQTPFGGEPVVRVPVACEPDAVLNEGRQVRQYPSNCADNPELINRYNLGLRIAMLEEEERDVSYLIASRDSRGPIGSLAFSGRSFRGFGSRAYLVGYRSDLKDELRLLKREAGLDD